jgi:hypothetical protein
VLYISVLDKKSGTSVTNLAPKDFRVTIGNKPVPVISAIREVRYRQVAILLDSSGSMERGKPKWQIATSLATAIAAAAPGLDTISFVEFGSPDSVVLTSLADHRAIVEQIGKLRDQLPLDRGFRRTDLWDNLLHIASSPVELTAGDSVFVITDGGENASKSNVRKVEESFVRKGVRLFGFVLVSNEPKTEEEFDGPENLREFAKRSGGDCFLLRGHSGPGVNSPINFPMSPQDRQGIQDTIVRFLEEAVRPYRVELGTEAAAMSGTFKIDILQRGLVRKDVLTLAPDKAFALN